MQQVAVAELRSSWYPPFSRGFEDPLVPETDAELEAETPNERPEQGEVDAISPKKSSRYGNRRRRKGEAVGGPSGSLASPAQDPTGGPSGSPVGVPAPGVEGPCVRRVSAAVCDPAVTLRAWQRRDTAQHYRTVSGHLAGVTPPNWTSVIRRLTMDRVTRELIEDVAVESLKMSEEFMQRRIAGGPRDIVATFV